MECGLCGIRSYRTFAVGKGTCPGGEAWWQRGHPCLVVRKTPSRPSSVGGPLNATSSGMAPFAKGKKPESHFLRALGWFHDAGLEESTARTFAGDAHAPLGDDLRNALIALFQMRWSGVEPELKREDWIDYQRLCLPESPDFIAGRPDYYAFFTYSMFHGKVAE